MNRCLIGLLLPALAGIVLHLVPSRSPGADNDAADAPFVELLPPTGKQAIGRRSFHWIDPNRKQLNGRACEVLAHLWYPAKKLVGATPLPYLPDFAAIRSAVGEAHLRAAAAGSYDALSTARTHSLADAEVSPELAKYPIVLLTHGLRYSSLGYSMLAEELASWGYVVVGIDHPVTAFAMILPDNRTAIFNEELWSKRRSADETREFERAIVEQCGNDLVFAINHLDELNRNTSASPFAGRLDLGQVGVVGHSFGGRVAARACQLDSRFRAGVLLDSFGRNMHVDRNADGSTVEQPMMIQYARRVPAAGIGRALALLQNGGKDLEEELRPVRRDFCQSVKAASYELTLLIPGVSHETFSDIPLLESGQSAAALKSRRLALQLVRDYTRAFFDRHVRGVNAPLLDAPTANPEEVVWTRHTFRGE